MKKSAFKIIRYVLALLFCALLTTCLGYINYVKVPVRVVIFIISCGCIAVAFFLEKRKKMLVIAGMAFSIILPIVFADGVLWGDKTEFTGIMLRGLARFSSDNRFKSDDELKTSLLQGQQFDENGYRKSTFEASDGYTYIQYVYNGSAMEQYTKNDDSNGKAILYLHGGAYIGALSDTFNPYIKSFCEETGGTAVYALDYKLAPEYKTEDILSDVMNAYGKVLADGYQPKDITLVGDSAGGGLALVICLYMRDGLHFEKAQMPGKVLTISAWTDLSMNSPSVLDNKEKDATFGHNRLLWMSAEEYAGGRLTDQYVSPVYATDYSNLPVIYMQCANYEMLRDDTVRFATNAQKMGADVTYDIYPGMFHEFQMMKGTLSVADEAWVKIIEFLK